MPERKTKIIKAAKQSFAVFGYKATTVDQIAKLAGVGKGTIYLFFQTKEDILNEIMSSLVSEMIREAERALNQEGTLFERLHHALYSVLTFRKEHDLLIKLNVEAREFGNQSAHNALLDIEAEVVSYIKLQLEKAMANGSMKRCDPELAAFVMFRVYKSLIFDWEQKHPPLEDGRISEVLELFFMEGMLLRS